MVRTNKPYAREQPYKKGNPDAPGTWKHDLHQSKPSLANRISSAPSSSRPSLLSRISGGKGKELLPSAASGSKLHGFGVNPPANPSNLNAGVELLPSTTRRANRGISGKSRLVDSGLNAALGINQPRRSNVRPLVSQGEDISMDGPVQGVSIMGAARGTTWVRVENLAQGTTPEDVVSAFAPAPISNARLGSSSTSGLVTVEIELASKADAEEIVKAYNGAVADGNALVVSIIRQGLAERMGRGVKPAPAPVSRPQAYAQPRQELLAPSGSNKMYSDTILASDPTSSIITLAEEQEAARNQRASAWQKHGPTLSQRIGVGRR